MSKKKEVHEIDLFGIQRFSDVMNRRWNEDETNSDWSLTDIACGLGGEAGELLNWIKKIRRLDDEMSKGVAYNKAFAKLAKESGKEMADMICYTVVLASEMGIDLRKALVEKFNEVSDRRKSKIYIKDMG